jgi:hypothetical protein
MNSRIILLGPQSVESCASSTLQVRQHRRLPLHNRLHLRTDRMNKAIVALTVTVGALIFFACATHADPNNANDQNEYLTTLKQEGVDAYSPNLQAVGLGKIACKGHGLGWDDGEIEQFLRPAAHTDDPNWPPINTRTAHLIRITANVHLC